MFKDKILNSLIKKYPAPKFENRSDKLFEDLLESIISQQLSVKASDTIYKRFLQLFSENYPLNPKNLLNLNNELIRVCGVSYQKIFYLKSVANVFASDLIDIKKIKQMSDEEAIETLTQIKGVGKWTAEMILIFTLKRPDVFSLGDKGLENAIKNLYGAVSLNDILVLSQTWKPYRSTACWYLWQSLDNK